MKKTEGKLVAAEKLRRERWEASKTKMIKVGFFLIDLQFLNFVINWTYFV